MSDTSRYILELQYDGTDFVGWQEQSKGRTIQGVIENRLSTILRTPIKVVGAGRTDTGVHATYMVAHFDLPNSLVPNIKEAVFRLNRFLPPDICILGVRQVSSDFHARFCAISRSYGYYITEKPNPFLRKYHTYIPQPLDFGMMNQAAEYLIGTHDFSSFSKKHSDVTNHLCTVTEARWVQLGDTEWVFRITANRFLRSMVRAIVGTLIEVGTGKMSPNEFAEILDKVDDEYPFNTAPATGLRLEHIAYPPHLLEP